MLFRSLIADPEDEFYREDEEEEDSLDVSLESIDLNIDEAALCEEDAKIYEELLYIVSSIDLTTLVRQNGCKCSLLKSISAIVGKFSEVQKLFPQSPEMKDLIADYRQQLSKTKDILWQRMRPKTVCNHDNEITSLFVNMKHRSNDPEMVKDFIKEKRQTIKKNVQKLCVAPGEKGKWQNWQDDVFLEEKMFPQIFPYGVGGYLSSVMLRNSNMGFANYIKSRLLSADDRFRKDKFYLFFLLLVKEMVEIKRSEQTYFRKATKASNLTPDVVLNISPDLLFRYNNAFQAFKTVRGTSAYYQDVKKRLMAFIRQKGAPTFFCTFSSAEFMWDEMIHKIYERVTSTTVSLEFIKEKDSAWRTKFVAENVVQVTTHFARRTEKLMSILTNDAVFTHNGIKYYVAEYFYRVEFQVRYCIQIDDLF